MRNRLKSGQADRCERTGLLLVAKGVGRLQVFSAGRLGDKQQENVPLGKTIFELMLDKQSLDEGNKGKF